MKLFRRLCVVCSISALASLAALWISDVLHGLRFTSTHRQVGASSLMLIGASYIGLQLSAKRRLSEMLKGVLLGVAFLFWGFEQLLPASALVTAMDSIVITIFVVDLSLIILEHLKRKDHETP